MRARIILGCLNFHNAEYNPTVSLGCGHSLVMSPRLLLICLLSGGLLTACQSLQSGGSGRGRGSLAGNGGYSDGNFYGDPSIPAPAGYPREGQEFDTAEGAPFSANDSSMGEVASVRPVSGSPAAGPEADPYGTAYAGSGASRVGSSYAGSSRVGSSYTGPSRVGTGSSRAAASPTPAASSYAGEHGAEQAEVRPYVEKPPVVVAETKPKSSGAAGSKAGASGSKKAVASSSGKKQATVASTGSARKTGGKSAGKEVKTAYSKTGQASGGKKGSKAGKASVVRVHEVKRGDSLSKLASRYGVTVAALKKRNKLSSSMIVVGKRLTID